MRNIGISLLAAAALALPAAAKSSAKAEVACNDGTTSKAGRGACSHHGGVAEDKSPSAGRAEKPARNKTRAELDEGSSNTTPRRSTREEKTPTARCKDGTISYSAHHSL